MELPPAPVMCPAEEICPMSREFARCSECGHEWYPRGRSAPRRCPNCGTKFSEIRRSSSTKGDPLACGIVALIVCGLIFAACAGCLFSTGHNKDRATEDREPADARRLATSLKAGDRVVLTAPTSHVPCGVDLGSFREYHQFSIVWDWEPAPDANRPEAPHWERRLAELLSNGRLVRVKVGSEGVVIGEQGRERIDRSEINFAPIEVQWVKVRFKEGPLYAPKRGLDKK